MITITTINNSWYFIKEIVIKPNTSVVYDEMLLNRSQAKDLLESISSQRVNLSSEDLVKVQDRYNSFNSVGNVDLSEALQNKASLGADGKVLTEQLPDIILAPAWSSISSKPTTLSGYGITDAYTKTQVDTAISGVSGAISRPKFAGGTKRYLTGVWHDFTFGWVPAPTSFTTTSIGGGNAWFYPFIPLENCVVSDLGICTGSNDAWRKVEATIVSKFNEVMGGEQE